MRIDTDGADASRPKCRPCTVLTQDVTATELERLTERIVTAPTARSSSSVR
jgi:hypothetical protein